MESPLILRKKDHAQLINEQKVLITQLREDICQLEYEQLEIDEEIRDIHHRLELFDSVSEGRENESELMSGVTFGLLLFLIVTFFLR